jgi:5-(carboxyamino)imidazole ribonucleotide mutase
MTALIGIIMGSTSDWETMQHAVHILEKFNIPHEVEVVSAHRTPDKLFLYAETAETKGIEVIIAGAGGAAHLPGMTAAKTQLPVLGVGTLAIGKAGAINAALLATAILANKYPNYSTALKAYREEQSNNVLQSPDPRRTQS